MATKKGHLEDVSEASTRLKHLAKQANEARESRKGSLEARLKATENLLADICEAVAVLLKDRIESARDDMEVYDRSVGAEAKKRIEAVFLEMAVARKFSQEVQSLNAL